MTEVLLADLSNPLAESGWAQGGFAAVLLDPPRDGALQVVKQLADRCYHWIRQIRPTRCMPTPPFTCSMNTPKTRWAAAKRSTPTSN